jgi:DNA-binding IclR family transcriptional regulator
MPTRSSPLQGSNDSSTPKEREARPALAAGRAVSVIDFLAAHPTEAFSLSELVQRLGINVASVHAILGVLTDAGYLSRHPRHRTYTLGPTLVAVGTAALDHHRAIDEARDEIRRLTDELGLELTVSAAVGNELIVVAHAGRHLAHGEPVHVGQRIPLVPPLGSVFVAWAPAQTIDAWISRARHPITTDDAKRYRSSLDAVRSHGYAIGLAADAHRLLVDAIDHLADQPHEAKLLQRVDSLLADLARSSYQFKEIDSSSSYAVSMIAAPVFGGDGNVTCTLTLLGFPPALGGQELRSYAERLRSAAQGVTRRMRGRQPSID